MVFLAWIAISCLFAAFLARSASRILLLRYGERAQGRLVRFRETTGDNPRTKAVYRFSPEVGGVLEFEEDASLAHRGNDPVLVRYWSFHPRLTASTIGPDRAWDALLGDLFPLFVTGALSAASTYVLLFGAF
ncbi:hypothetical protein SAMN05421805_106253 [Saccharopolyspora antimicrobica]|uniref:DUF3592 domain-containing protein n=1 Tax=Saccharopolyspora antimicrobica TaxID=455193 RepID=A0A1I5BG18_9PSEU|nr:hypothetical protein ATL45_4978 [Saccharopolyspora antimicrobica]SFN73617.1 hypothetical protein SAMN05421805_106253 [Saccharopolyspora antimicrobica]